MLLEQYHHHNIFYLRRLHLIFSLVKLPIPQDNQIFCKKIQSKSLVYKDLNLIYLLVQKTKRRANRTILMYCQNNKHQLNIKYITIIQETSYCIPDFIRTFVDKIIQNSFVNFFNPSQRIFATRKVTLCWIYKKGITTTFLLIFSSLFEYSEYFIMFDAKNVIMLLRYYFSQT